MVEIIAKESGVVKIVNGDFPLGNRDTLLVHITDPLVSEKIKLTNTNICEKQYNQYSYGDFEDSENILNYISLVPEDSEYNLVNLVYGQGKNFSRCLHFYTDSPYKETSTVTLLPDKNELTIDTKYIVSFYLYIGEGSLDIEGFSGSTRVFDVKNQESTNDGWIYFIQEFTAVDTTFSLVLSSKSCDCNIDNLMLFEADKAIVVPMGDITAKINIINPCNNLVSPINKIISWKTVNDGLIDILFYLPEITNVDFKDNILCVLEIYQVLPKQVSTLGNLTYNEVINILYETQPFVLNGYIVSDTYPNGDDMRY